jgi:hypothetical protein
VTQITVLRDRTVPAATDGGAEGLSLADALAREWPTDAHFIAHAPVAVPIVGEDRTAVVRLAKDAVGEVPIRMVALVGDVDDEAAHAEHRPASDEWRAEVEPRLAASELAWYRTRGGARVVAVLAEPFAIASKQDAAEWSARHAAWCAALRERYGLEIDQHTHDWTRLFRLPNVVRDGEPQRAELHGRPPRVTLPLPATPVEAPRVEATTPSREDAATYAGASAIVAALGDWRDWQGSKHAICGALAGMLRKAQWSAEDCEAVLREWLPTGEPGVDVDAGIAWARRAWTQPLDAVSGRQALDSIVGAQLGSIIEQGALLPWRARPEIEPAFAPAEVQPAAASGWRIVRMSDPEEPIDWRCHGLRLATSRGKISVIAGQPGVGKGPLADYLAVCLALGLPAFGQHACLGAPTILLDWEDTRLTMRRLRRMTRALGRDPLDLDDRLTVVDTTDVFDPLSDAWQAQLTSEVTRLGARHMIVDSYTSAMLGTGIEANSQLFAGLAQQLGRLDVLVLAVAHANKASAESKRPRLADVMGTGALGALAQTAILVHRPDEEDEHRVRLSCARGPEGRFSAFDVRFVDTDTGGLALDALPAEDASAKPRPAAMPSATDHTQSVRVAGIRLLRVLVDEPLTHAFAELERRGGEGPKAAKQALARLCDAGLAECTVGQYSATYAGQTATEGQIAQALGVVAGFSR